MKKEWFSSHELITIDGLPSTIQGINQKARREKWLSRKRVGIQGRAVEYHIGSLPELAQNQIKVWEGTAPYTGVRNDPFNNIWLTTYNQFTPRERTAVTAWIVRHGITGLVSLADKEHHSSCEDLDSENK